MLNKQIYAALLALLLMTGLISCGSGDVTVETLGTSAQLVSISVTPTNPSIALGTDQQFTATGIYSDNTTKDLTDSVAWSSSDTTVAAVDDPATALGLLAAVVTGAQTVNKAGHVIGKAIGRTTIKATSGSRWGSTDLTVTPASLASIAVTPTNPSVAKGTTKQFTATGTFSDNTTQDLTTTVTWSSSAAAVATVSNAAGSNGSTTSVNTGSTTITATSGDVSGSTTLTVTPATLVSMAITPANPSIADGTTQQFTATATYSDGTTQNLTTAVTWSSSSTGVATVSNTAGSKGLATSVAAGSTSITATSGDVSGSTTLTVTPATLVSIAITPTNPSIAQGTTRQFTATGTYSDSTTQNLTTTVTWSSSNTGIATISNAAGSKGLATSVAAGSTTITATSGSVSGTTSLTVTAPVTGNATLAWSAPATNVDGSTLTDLAGYKIYYGTSPGSYTKVIDVGNVTTSVVNNLAPGTYYFTVTAYNIYGVESSYSNEASKVIP
jgi:uncharacterized protein YjdB